MDFFLSFEGIQTCGPNKFCCLAYLLVLIYLEWNIIFLHTVTPSYKDTTRDQIFLSLLVAFLLTKILVTHTMGFCLIAILRN